MAGSTTGGVDEGPVMGAALGLTVYGLVVVFLSATRIADLVPSGGRLGLLIILVLAVGAAVGAAIDLGKRAR